jgi:hypothetical protein
MSSWTNDAGEPIMSGEAWRYEQHDQPRRPPMRTIKLTQVEL